MLSDRVAMGGSGQKRAKDQKVERALQKLHTGNGISVHCVDILRLVAVECLQRMLIPALGH